MDLPIQSWRYQLTFRFEMNNKDKFLTYETLIIISTLISDSHASLKNAKEEDLNETEKSPESQGP